MARMHRHRQHLALCLVAIWIAGTEADDVRPSEHGLDNQKDPGAASPATVAFFRGQPGVALPEAWNVSEPAWAVAPPGLQRKDRSRSALLAAGVACGVVGSTLLVAAVTAIVVRARRSDSGIGSACALGSARGRSRPEIRLGTP